MDIHHRAGTPRLHQLGTPHIHFPHTGLELWTTHQRFHAFSQGGGWSWTWIGIYIPTIWRAVLGALWTAVAKSGSCDPSVWWTHWPAGGHETLARRWQQQGVHVRWRSTGAAACWASWRRKRSPALLHSVLEKGHRPLPHQRHQCPRCSLRRAEGMTGQEWSSEPPSASRMPGEHLRSTRTLCFYSSGRSRDWPPHWSREQNAGSNCRVRGIVVPGVGSQLRIDSTSFGFGRTPSAEMMWPRKRTSCCRSLHLEGLSFKLASSSRPKASSNRSRFSSMVRPKIMMSSRYMSRVRHCRPLNTNSMHLWNVLGAEHRPKGILMHSNNPYLVIKAVLWISASSTLICQYPDCRSKVEK